MIQRTADSMERTLAARRPPATLGVAAGIKKPVTLPVSKPSIARSAIQGLASLYNSARSVPGAQLSSPVNTGRGVSMGGQQNAIQNVVEPTRLAVRRAVGDITAIPGVGQPSASPTAADFRAGNYVGPVADYVGLAAEIIPGSIPAFQEAKRALGNAIAKTVKPLPLDVPIPKTAAPVTPNEYMRLTQRGRNVRFRQDQLPELFQSAKNYWGQDYPQFQNYLRNPDEIVPYLTNRELMNLRTDISQIDELFKKAPPISDPIVVYRGVKRSWNNNKSDFMRMLDNLKPGDTFTEPAFSSTTIDSKMGQGFADRDIGGYVFEIEVPQGSKIISPLHGWPFKPTQIDPESEFLLPRNSRFQVVDRNENTIRLRLMP